MTKTMIRTIATLIVSLLMVTEVWAHKTSDSYLSITSKDAQLIGTWRIPLDVLDTLSGYQLKLDQNQDDSITWGELSIAEPAIRTLVFSKLSFHRHKTSCDLAHNSFQLDRINAEVYLYFEFSILCDDGANAVELDYQLFFDRDPSHRGLLTYSSGVSNTSFILSPTAPSAMLEHSTMGVFENISQFLKEGIWHIWVGVDHLLFLLALLVPAIFTYKDKHRQIQQSFSAVLVDGLKVVTGFTLAHSITLILASLKLLSVPDRIIESIIAFSVVLSGLMIFNASFHRYRWQLAFLFGLIHGFGFANVLRGLHQTTNDFAISLLAFNVGVEIGQLIIVIILLPLMFLLRKHPFYQNRIIPGCAALMVCIGLIWMFERALGIHIITS